MVEIATTLGGRPCFITLGGPWHCIGGYKFEMHNYCGPTLLKENGELREGMLGPRHKFWPQFEKWQKFNQEMRDQTEIELRGKVWHYRQSGQVVGSKRAAREE